jgi:hypothetical protein
MFDFLGHQPTSQLPQVHDELPKFSARVNTLLGLLIVFTLYLMGAWLDETPMPSTAEQVLQAVQLEQQATEQAERERMVRAEIAAQREPGVHGGLQVARGVAR